MSDKQPANSDHVSEQAAVTTWQTLTPDEQKALKRVGKGFDVFGRQYTSLFKLGLIKNTHGITDLGRALLAQASDEGGTGEAEPNTSAIIDHLSTQWVQLHQELSTALGLDFEPNEDIERYTEAIEAIRQQLRNAEAATRLVERGGVLEWAKEAVRLWAGNGGLDPFSITMNVLSSKIDNYERQASTDGSATAASADDNFAAG